MTRQQLEGVPVAHREDADVSKATARRMHLALSVRPSITINNALIDRVRSPTVAAGHMLLFLAVRCGVAM